MRSRGVLVPCARPKPTVFQRVRFKRSYRRTEAGSTRIAKSISPGCNPGSQALRRTLPLPVLRLSAGRHLVGHRPETEVLRGAWSRRRVRASEKLVDLKGFEPLTSSMPWRRAPNCATGPLGLYLVILTSNNQIRLRPAASSEKFQLSGSPAVTGVTFSCQNAKQQSKTPSKKSQLESLF